MTCGCFGAKSIKAKRPSYVPGEIDGEDLVVTYILQFHYHLCAVKLYINWFQWLAAHTRVCTMLVVLWSAVFNWKYLFLEFLAGHFFFHFSFHLYTYIFSCFYSFVVQAIR